MAARALAQPAKVQRAAEPGRPAPSSSDRRRIQPSLQVSRPNDAAEREAEFTAHKVMTMRAPAVAPRERVSILAARAPAPAPAPTPAPPDESRTSSELTSAIKTELGGGSGLPLEVRSFMEPRFKADLSGVRIHTDARAENLTTRLGARAFTYGRDIFFNRGQFQPDSDTGMELIAHELTHTIQQREVVQREVVVKETGSPRVQRGIISRALDWIADKANYIPGFRLFTIIIGLNPINMSKVDRSGANILRALVEFLPGGGLIVDALDNYGIFEKGGKFIEDQFRSLGMVGSMFRDALMNFIDLLGWSDVFHLGDVWDRAKRIFTDPIDRLINFGKSLVAGVITIIKDAILKPLAALVSKTRAWDLLCAVMGKNPITGEKVERSADTLIGGFMKLIGQEEIWNNIKKANAISRAWNWFKTALNGLMTLVMSIPDRFITALKSLVIMDIVVITRVFAKVGGVFAGFIGDFLSWAGGTVLSLLEIILEVVAPAAVPYLKKAGGAFKTIIKDPIRFVRTLVRAAVQGFKQFASNFLTHLKASLIGWLTGALGGTGVYIPQGFTLLEILKFVLSVMGLYLDQHPRQARQGHQRDDGQGARDHLRHRQDPGHRGPGGGLGKDRRDPHQPQGDGDRGRDGFREIEGRRSRRHQAPVNALARRRVHPGDHRDLQHDHVLRGAHPPDRPGRSQLHRRDRRHRRRQHRSGRRPRRNDHGRAAYFGDQLPRPHRRPGQGQRRDQGPDRQDPGAHRQGVGQGRGVDRRDGEEPG